MLWILFRLMDGEFPFGGICNPAANEYKDLQSEITRLRSASKQITDIFSGLKILILGCGRIKIRPNEAPETVS